MSHLPLALTRLLDRGLLPHASILVGGDDTAHAETVAAIRSSLQIATVDALVVSEIPTIEELRQILGRIHLKPFQSSLSLLAFHHVDGWKEELATVLLKTLEEPPAHARIVLFANQDASLLPTIRSRSARFRFTVTTPTADASLPSDLLDQSLADQFAWSKDATKDASEITSTLQALLGQAPTVSTQAALLERLADTGTHTVNKRLALDAALLQLHTARSL